MSSAVLINLVSIGDRKAVRAMGQYVHNDILVSIAEFLLDPYLVAKYVCYKRDCSILYRYLRPKSVNLTDVQLTKSKAARLCATLDHYRYWWLLSCGIPINIPLIIETVWCRDPAMLDLLYKAISESDEIRALVTKISIELSADSPASFITRSGSGFRRKHAYALMKPKAGG